ncbi:hypothetical protein CCR75_008094 [Bremia lactucae]|uniref:Uncharacterized protein n=1 Tax=Bremia lactucae TaxID=4779 RepID=A0A976FJZ6_BRELC|nr:hypothetical protein CCR75_008094 [Bremia lactucae]
METPCFDDDEDDGRRIKQPTKKNEDLEVDDVINTCNGTSDQVMDPVSDPSSFCLGLLCS